VIEGKRILITGGGGFIGSTLAEPLLENNDVVVYDNFSRNSLQHKAYKNHPNLTVIEGDVLDYDAVREATEGANLVVHCAAIAGIDTVIASPVTTMRVNMIGSANVLQAASEWAGCDRVLCFSTSEIFGQHAFRSDETDPAVLGQVGEARWTYAVSKLAEEHLAIAYYKERQLPTTVVRPFNIYGPGQIGEGALRTFIKRAIKDEPIEIHGDGTQIRAWCYVDDMVDGVLACLDHEAAVGQALNIGNPRSVLTIYNLARDIVNLSGSSSPITFVPWNNTDVELRIPNIDKARDLIDFEPKIDLEEGLLRTIDWYRTKKQS